jgi:hypothetical protein
MADQKLSELTLATGAVSSDLLYVVQGATSKKIAFSSLAVSLSTAMTTRFVLPVFSSTSNATATTGSTFIHSVENKIYWYTGTGWTPLT